MNYWQVTYTVLPVHKPIEVKVVYACRILALELLTLIYCLLLSCAQTLHTCEEGLVTQDQILGFTSEFESNKRNCEVK